MTQKHSARLTFVTGLIREQTRWQGNYISLGNADKRHWANACWNISNLKQSLLQRVICIINKRVSWKNWFVFTFGLMQNWPNGSFVK